MNETHSRIATAIATHFPHHSVHRWILDENGKLRIFLPVEATLDGVIKLRSWLVQQRFMYTDGGFTVKGDDGEAYLSAYLDLQEVGQ